VYPENFVFRNNNFDSTCKHFRLPDDMMIGMVVGKVCYNYTSVNVSIYIEVLLGYNLTTVSSIKTHLQSLSMLRPEELVNMV